MKYFTPLIGLIIIFSACQKKTSVMDVRPAATTDSVKQVDSAKHADFIRHTGIYPYNDTFYGQWNQFIPYTATFYTAGATGYSLVFIHYDAAGVFEIRCDSFGTGKRRIGVMKYSVNDSGKYVYSARYNDGFDNYTFTLTNDTLSCIMDQSDGMCGGDDFPGTYVGYKK